MHQYNEKRTNKQANKKNHIENKKVENRKERICSDEKQWKTKATKLLNSYYRMTHTLLCEIALIAVAVFIY